MKSVKLLTFDYSFQMKNEWKLDCHPVMVSMKLGYRYMARSKVQTCIIKFRNSIQTFHSARYADTCDARRKRRIQMLQLISGLLPRPNEINEFEENESSH